MFQQISVGQFRLCGKMVDVLQVLAYGFVFLSKELSSDTRAGRQLKGANGLCGRRPAMTRRPCDTTCNTTTRHVTHVILVVKVFFFLMVQGLT